MATGMKSNQAYFTGALGEFRLVRLRNRIEKLIQQERDKVHPQMTFEVPIKHPERFQPGNTHFAAARRNCERYAAELQDEFGTDGYTVADGYSIRIDAACEERNGRLNKFSLAVRLV